MVLRVYAAICGAAIFFVYSSSAMGKLGTIGAITAKARYRHSERRITIRARRAKTRNAASRRELPWAAASLARPRCMIPFCPDTMKAA